MKSFNQYTNNEVDLTVELNWDANIPKLFEANTSAALEMEKVIVDGANGKGVESSLIDNAPEVGKKIVQKCRLKGKGKFPANSYPSTPNWNKHFEGGKAKGSTLTPKTDIVVGSDKISVKTGNGKSWRYGRSE